ncbi:MAG: peptidyl-prolyl cis-trans isomerase [Parvularculaceae bacterium]|nr:peptidyl-prolyl cis-trans isomerase [Parvularculaceae bacterium]
MLNQVRNGLKSALKGVAAWFIVILLILAFAAWGVPEIRQFTQSQPVRVGKEGYSITAVQNEFNRWLTTRRLESQGEVNRADAIAAGVPNQLIATMTTRSAIEQEARKMGLVMPRSMVSDYLQSNPQFTNPRTGKFDNEILTGILRNYDFTVREFEGQLRADLLREQLVGSVSGGAVAPEPMLDGLVYRDIESRKVSYLTVTDDMTGTPAEPTPDALQQYYKEHAAQFMAPELRTITAVVLEEDDFRDKGAVTDDQLRDIFETRKALYEQPERRTLYQITYDSEAAANAAAAALNDGRPFEALAADKGLTLDAVTFTDAAKTDLLDPNVAEAAFNPDIAEGGVVGPVKGLFGYVVGQVAAITPPEVQTFEDVRDDILSEFLSQDTKKRLFDAIEEMENERDTGASIEDAATKVGVQAIQYGPLDSFSFGKGGEIIAGVPGEVLAEAFRLEQGEESEAVELADNSGYFFVAVNDITPPALIDYEDVADEVETGWRRQEREQRIAKSVGDIRSALAEGKTLTEAAEPFNRAPVSETISRRYTGEAFNAAVLEQIFAVTKGEDLSGPVGLGDGQVVVVVDDINFNLSRVSPDDVSMFAQYIGSQLDQELLDAYATAVRNDYGVKINQTQIDEFFSDGQ